MTASDWAIVFATLLGPILAVQAQKFVERSREKQNRRLWIFRTLMTTRAASLSTPHVEALNTIAIDFYGWRPRFRSVIDAWKVYLDHLSQDQVDAAVWGQKRIDLFVELLYKMAPTVGYKFTKVEISREIYSPRAHAQVEQDQQTIREGFARIFKGDAALPLNIVSFPTDPMAIENQAQLQKEILALIRGERTVKVDTNKD